MLTVFCFQASLDDLTGQYAAAAHAIMGQPSLTANSNLASVRGDMMSIADTSEAAKRDKIVGSFSLCF